MPFVEVLEQTDDHVVARLVVQPTVDSALTAAEEIVALPTDGDVVLDVGVLNNVQSIIIGAISHLAATARTLTLKNAHEVLRDKLEVLKIESRFRFSG